MTLTKMTLVKKWEWKAVWTELKFKQGKIGNRVCGNLEEFWLKRAELVGGPVRLMGDC